MSSSTPFLLTSKLLSPFEYQETATNNGFRYEVEGDAPAWAEAEQAVKEGKSGVVSVKSSKSKRKAGPSAADVYEEAFGDKSHKKAKKSKKDRS